MLKEIIINIINYIGIISFIAASVFFRPEFAYPLYIWTTIILIAMLANFTVCERTIPNKNIDRTLITKYKILLPYIKGGHLPAIADAIFYGIIILFSGFYGMIVTSTCWLVISLLDFKLRDMAEKVKPIIFDDRFKNFINIIEGGKK